MNADKNWSRDAKRRLTKKDSASEAHEAEAATDLEEGQDALAAACLRNEGDAADDVIVKAAADNIPA